MGHLKRQLLMENEMENYSPDIRYDLAYKRVKRMKGFYVHVVVYILVNAFLLILAVNKSEVGVETFWSWQTWNTVFFWGIGLIAHGVSVFGGYLIFNKDWEERKIRELIEKDKSKMEK